LRKLHPKDEKERLRVWLKLCDRAADLVEEHWSEIKALAKALLKHKTLSGEDVRRIAFANGSA
jgi:ATP-dependent Zn protease